MFKGKLNDEGPGLELRTKTKSKTKSEIPHFVRDDKKGGRDDVPFCHPEERSDEESGLEARTKIKSEILQRRALQDDKKEKRGQIYLFIRRSLQRGQLTGAPF